MSILTRSEVKNAFQRLKDSHGIYKEARQVALDTFNTIEGERKKGTTYDIFLSHAAEDAELILGLKQILEERGKSVYIDWIDDPELDRSNVKPVTASILRERMNSCKTLFFVDTTGSINSKWMPWECGYFDGAKNGKVVISPVRDSANSNYAGREFLGLYYYVTFENSTESEPSIWVRRSHSNYIHYDSWLKGLLPYERL